MTYDNDPIDEVAEVILRYVVSCPKACDTVDGICDWWIPRQRYIEAKSVVLAALKRLTARGQITMRTGTDGQVLFQACTTSAS